MKNNTLLAEKFISNNYQNIGKVLNQFIAEFKEKKESKIKSCIFRYTLPELGWKTDLTKKKLGPSELTSAFNFVNSLPVEDLFLFLDAFEHFTDKSSLSNQTISKYRYELIFFLKWVDSQKILPDLLITEESEIKPFSFGHFRGKTRTKTRLYPKPNSENYAISLSPESYPNSELIKDDLVRINQEINDFQLFLQEDLNYLPKTIKVRREIALLYLGWLHHIEKVSLANLSLSFLVPFSPIYISPSADKDSYFRNLAFSQEKAKSIAKKTVQLIERFLSWRDFELAPKTKESYVEVALSIAKFIYRQETDICLYQKYQDIPVVCALRILRNKYDNIARHSPSTIPYEEKSIHWEKAQWVLEQVRLEATLSHCEYIDSADQKLKRKRREIEAVAGSMMRFLILALLILIPPGRIGEYNIIRWGKNLKYGLYQEKVFIPAADLDDVTQARFYLHYLPNEYKTGKTYGVWIGELPDTLFRDGTTFYQYLELWLIGKDVNNPVRKLINFHELIPFREVLKPDNHDYVFFGLINKQPVNEGILAAKVRACFFRLTDVPINPQTLRNMYRTYVDELDVDEATSESIAIWMKHDLKTARRYSRVTMFNNLKPGANLIQRINTSLLR